MAEHECEKRGLRSGEGQGQGCGSSAVYGARGRRRASGTPAGAPPRRVPACSRNLRPALRAPRSSGSQRLPACCSVPDASKKNCGENVSSFAVLNTCQQLRRRRSFHTWTNHERSGGCLQNGQLLGQGSQVLITVLPEDHHVLNAHTELAGQIDPRFGAGHSGRLHWGLHGSAPLRRGRSRGQSIRRNRRRQ